MFFELLGAFVALESADDDSETEMVELVPDEEPEVNYWGPSVEA